MSRVSIYLLVMGGIALAAYALLSSHPSGQESDLGQSEKVALSAAHLIKSPALSGLASASTAASAVVVTSSEYHIGDMARVWSLGADELYAVFKRGMSSSNAADRYAAFTALSFCMPMMSKTLDWSASTVARQRTAEMDLARSHMLDRCRLFGGLDGQEIKDSWRQLSSATADESSAFASSRYELGRFDSDGKTIDGVRDRLSQAFKTYGADALMWAGPGLSTWLEVASRDEARRSSLDPALRDGDLSAAVVLAMCNAGYPCDSASISYQYRCATEGACGGSIQQQIVNALRGDDEQRARIEHQAMVIAEAIQTGNLARLGLGVRTPSK